MESPFVKLVKATYAHAEDLGVHLSDEDFDELTINKGGVYVDSVVALAEGIKASEESYAIVNAKTGITYAIGGYTSMQTCWFLTSKYVKNFSKAQRKEFALLLVEGRDIGLKVYPALFNFIWTGNPEHVEFTKRCGARMFNPLRGVNGHSYIQFEFHREDFPHLI